MDLKKTFGLSGTDFYSGYIDDDYNPIWRGKTKIDLIEETSDSLTALEFKWGDKTPVVPKAFGIAYPEASFSVVNRDNYLRYL